MAVYYKFKSAKDYDSIPMDGHFISVGNLKEKIFESKHLGRGTDFDLLVTNAQTNEEYIDEAMLIPKNTSVLVRRVPGRPRMPIVTAPVPELEESKVENTSEDVQPANSSFPVADSSVMRYPEDSEWDEFGNDLYAIPEVFPVQLNNSIQDAPPPTKADEDSKIKALIDTPSLDWQCQNSDGFGTGRGFGRGMGGRMMGGRGFGRGGFERKTPPQGYVCYRCKVPGHFIQHCPTNGDPNFDIKRVKPPTGIPKSMLMATPDGSYSLPSGVVAVLKPNEAAFEKEIEGLPSTHSVGDFLPELRCPLCKEVMKDAVLTSKCCFTSFCDKCIRDYSISKSMCVCGATNILADDLLPNKTLRDTINRILESNNSSAENGGSAFHVQDLDSLFPQPKVPSPTQSAASKGRQVLPPPKEDTLKVQETAEEAKVAKAPQQTLEEGSIPKVAQFSEAVHEPRSMKQPASHGSAPLVDEEGQPQKPVSGDAGKKKKKKKPGYSLSTAEMQWRSASQDLPAESYMMPMGHSAYNPFWTGMQPGMDGYMAPYSGAMPYMGYGLGPLDVPFGGILPQDPFGMMPFVPPQRDLANFGLGFNAGPPLMSREEFEARKANLKRRREIERCGERELSKDHSRESPQDKERGREMSSRGGITSMKSKSKSLHPSSTTGHHHHRSNRSERSSPECHSSRDPDLPCPSSSKRKSTYNDDNDDYYHHHSESSSAVTRPFSTASEPPLPPPHKSTAILTNDKKHKTSVFSRINFTAENAVAVPSKKRKVSSSLDAPGSGSMSYRTAVNGYYDDHKMVPRKKSCAAIEYESSDEDKHFKRRRSRYEASPPEVEVTEWAEEPRHSRGSRERDGGGYSSNHR